MAHAKMFCGIVLERTLAHLQDRYIAFFNLDRSLCLPNLQHWLAHSADYFDTIPERWKLQELAVDPAFQRRGIGALLMQWGKQQAETERCPIGLSSSAMGVGLYLREGFQRYATMRVEGFPVEEVPVLLWEPPGIKVTC